jgi:predicted dehydrogenase
MTRTALIACALFAATAAPAFAGEAPRAAQPATQSSARVLVAVCERDALTQASFRQNYGARPVYVTAEQVLSARAAGERWSAPRCMTTGGHQRLTQALNGRTGS